jgi:hypothetical protein
VYDTLLSSLFKIGISFNKVIWFLFLSAKVIRFMMLRATDVVRSETHAYDTVNENVAVGPYVHMSRWTLK